MQQKTRQCRQHHRSTSPPGTSRISSASTSRRSTAWRNPGSIPAIKVGRQWRFPADDIEQWLGEARADEEPDRRCDTPLNAAEASSPRSMAQDLRRPLRRSLRGHGRRDRHRRTPGHCGQQPLWLLHRRVAECTMASPEALYRPNGRRWAVQYDLEPRLASQPPRVPLHPCLRPPRQRAHRNGHRRRHRPDDWPPSPDEIDPSQPNPESPRRRLIAEHAHPKSIWLDATSANAPRGSPAFLRLAGTSLGIASRDREIHSHQTKQGAQREATADPRSRHRRDDGGEQAASPARARTSGTSPSSISKQPTTTSPGSCSSRLGSTTAVGRRSSRRRDFIPAGVNLIRRTRSSSSSPDEEPGAAGRWKHGSTTTTS